MSEGGHQVNTHVDLVGGVRRRPNRRLGSGEPSVSQEVFDGDGCRLDEGALLEGVEGDVERRLGVFLGGKSALRRLTAPTHGVMADVDDVRPGSPRR